MKALEKLDEFKGPANGNKVADAYLCGYYRGLQKAAYLLGQIFDVTSITDRGQKHLLKLIAGKK
jgi:hypothetical protein